MNRLIWSWREGGGGFRINWKSTSLFRLSCQKLVKFRIFLMAQQRALQNKGQPFFVAVQVYGILATDFRIWGPTNFLSNKHFHSVEKAQHPHKMKINAMPWLVRKFVGHELWQFVGPSIFLLHYQPFPIFFSIFPKSCAISVSHFSFLIN